MVAYNGGGNSLEWEPSEEEDFDYFRVYRFADPDFIPGAGNLVHSTSGTSWNDMSGSGGDYYKITAVDFSGNESDPTAQQVATGIGGPPTSARYALGDAVPNPFNPSTVIAYTVPPGGGQVDIAIFDVAGRAVRTLVSGAQPGGRHDVTWDGLDDRGRRASSGVYFYRMEGTGFSATRKMVMLK
jgi:hypothetical protein